MEPRPEALKKLNVLASMRPNCHGYRAKRLPAWLRATLEHPALDLRGGVLTQLLVRGDGLPRLNRRETFADYGMRRTSDKILPGGEHR